MRTRSKFETGDTPPVGYRIRGGDIHTLVCPANLAKHGVHFTTPKPLCKDSLHAVIPARAVTVSRVNRHLGERQRRIEAGSVARALGRGGIVAVAEATGMSRSTVQDAVGQIDEGTEVSDRVRSPRRGDVAVVDTDPTLRAGLDSLVVRGRWAVGAGDAPKCLSYKGKSGCLTS